MKTEMQPVLNERQQRAKDAGVEEYMNMDVVQCWEECQAEDELATELQDKIEELVKHSSFHLVIDALYIVAKRHQKGDGVMEAMTALLGGLSGASLQLDV